MIYATPVSAQTESDLQADVNTLNRLVTMSYSNWAATYDGLRTSSTYEDMDWSQDECSAPLGGLGFNDDFRMACLRHDMMYRSLAAIDRATGRVWNERNRYKADKVIKDDTAAYCAITITGADPASAGSYLACQGASNAYYLAVRRFAGFRTALASGEGESVTDTGHAQYVDGMKVMPAASCAYVSDGDTSDGDDGDSGNRCLPINYIERNGVPFVPQNMSIVPTGTAIEVELVRANLQSLEGPPGPQLSYVGSPGPAKYTGDLAVTAHAPFVVGNFRSINCRTENDSRTIYGGAYAYPVSTSDTTLKRTTFYIRACRALSEGQLDDPMIEIKPVTAAPDLARYIINTDDRLRHYQRREAS